MAEAFADRSFLSGEDIVFVVTEDENDAAFARGSKAVVVIASAALAIEEGLVRLPVEVRAKLVEDDDKVVGGDRSRFGGLLTLSEPALFSVLASSDAGLCDVAEARAETAPVCCADDAIMAKGNRAPCNWEGVWFQAGL